jgi:hypothetical protein
MKVDLSHVEKKETLGLIELRNAKIGEKVRGYFGINGIYKGGGWIELGASSSDEEEILNEWTDEVWRNQIANDSLVKVRSIHNSKFFGSGKVKTFQRDR